MSMLKRRFQKYCPKQRVLFQGIDESPVVPLMIPLDFETHAVRVVMIEGNPWWVASDVCRCLDLDNHRQALERLDDDEKGVTTNDTLGGPQEMLIINESGLYNLIFTSRKEEAKRFRKWVTSEVLPAIRKTGYYRLPVHKRILKEQRRLGCDMDTAVVRCEQFKVNRQDNERLYSEGVNAAEWHDAGYLGAYGKRAQKLREEVGLPKGKTPLDRFSCELLYQNLHSKAIATRLIRERSIDPEKQPSVLRGISNQQMRADLKRLGNGTIVGVVDGGKRGMIHDFICSLKQIEDIS